MIHQSPELNDCFISGVTKLHDFFKAERAEMSKIKGSGDRETDTTEKLMIPEQFQETTNFLS